MQKFVVPLGSKESLIADNVGTKAANLAFMINKGIPVPPGFCITVDAYSAFSEEYGFLQRITSLFKDADMSNPHLVGAVAETIRSIMNDAEIPRYVMDEINPAFDALTELTGIAELKVAVRSSAVAEDLASASFAGQYETILNVRRDGLPAAIKECWLSLWAIKGILYRGKKAIDHSSSLMGILVQAMIPAEAAGVVFTASPSGKDDGLIWINAGFGVGEGIVSGRFNSDIYKVEKKSLGVVHKEVRKKDSAYFVSSRGIEEKILPAEIAGSAVLSDEEIQELASLAHRVESISNTGTGYFADIEWAFLNKKFYILQVRPICAANTAVSTQQSVTEDSRHKMQVAKTPITISEFLNLLKHGNMSETKKVMAEGNVKGVSMANIHRIVGACREFPQTAHNIKTFYANLFKGGIEGVNFMKLSAYLPKLWEGLPEEFKKNTLEGVEYILKTGSGFSGTNLADIMRYGLPLAEKDMPYIKAEWVKTRIIESLDKGTGMEDASVNEVINTGLKMLKRNYDWLDSVLKNGISRILRQNLKPLSFSDIKNYCIPALQDEKFIFREDLKRGVIKLLAEGKTKTDLADAHTGLKMFKESGIRDIGLKEALIAGLKICLNQKKIYTIADTKDEGIIYAVFKPITYLLKDAGSVELETAFYRNAGALFDEGLEGVDADDSMLALKDVLLLASEYTPHRRLEAARRGFIERVYKNLPGASIMGIDWQSLHNDFEDITDVVPTELKRLAVDLRDSFHNTLDSGNLVKAQTLLNELLTNYPGYTKAIKLAEGIVHWLTLAYRPVVEQAGDVKKIEGLWSDHFRICFKELISLYREFESTSDNGKLIDAVVSHSKIRACIGRLLLNPDMDISREDRLTLYLTDINLERLEQGFSSIVNERFSTLSGLSDLYELSHWIKALLFSASRYLIEIEDNLSLAEGFSDALKEGSFFKAREIWCRIKTVVSSLTESRRVLSLVLFDIPAEKIDSFFFAISPIAAGEAEGYVRIFERVGDERLARVLNDPVKGIKEDEVIVIEYLPEISELKIFPKAFIIEKGSVGSHTAKVAVEFGIPAVRMEGATKRFKEGERVFVKVPPMLDKAEAGSVSYERITMPKGDVTPFHHGSAEGIVRFYRGDVEFLKPPGKREIFVLSYLDIKYLDVFAEGDGPSAIIVEKGGELSHPMIVAREMLIRLKRTMPILRLENAFDILKEGTAVKIFIPEDMGGAEIYKTEKIL